MTALRFLTKFRHVTVRNAGRSTDDKIQWCAADVGDQSVIVLERNGNARVIWNPKMAQFAKAWSETDALWDEASEADE